MRFTGATFLLLGLLLSLSIDEGEAIGLIPMGIGLILLTVAENKASALELAEVVLVEREADKVIAPPPQHQFPTADEVRVSADVLLLLERLSQSAKLR